MTCQDARPQISALIDGDLAADARAAVSAHVDGCTACAAAARDLERIRGAAHHLGPIDPPPHVWLEIAGRIRLEQGQEPAPAAARPARAPAWRQWVALAAGLVLVTLGAALVNRVLIRRPAPVSAPAPPSSTASVASFADELQQATTHYEKAIAALETIEKTDSGTMDPTVAATLQKSLSSIDDAISQSRTALTENPDSAPARESLLDALQRKVTVLQDTVQLINEMRNGDQAAAAQAAAGLSKKS